MTQTEDGVMSMEPLEIIERMGVLMAEKSPAIRVEMTAYCLQYATVYYHANVPEKVRAELQRMEDACR